MRLTNFLRDAFVRAAMQDVPKIDYVAQAEKIARDAVKAQFAADFPGISYEKIQATSWFESSCVYLPGTMSSIFVPIGAGRRMLERNTEVWSKLEKLNELNRAQDEKHRVLHNQLRAVAYACTNRKQLLEALPEFESYIPAEPAKAAANLPAVVGVFADFVKAGWPKDQKKLVKA